ncbi:MAG: sulfur carrier protein ThiS [Planctomycetota bacterium]
MPEITLNGETRAVAAQNIADLLRELGLDDQPVAVERNRAVAPKKQHPQTPVETGDRIELVTLVGGG